MERRRAFCNIHCPYRYRNQVSLLSPPKKPQARWRHEPACADVGMCLGEGALSRVTAEAPKLSKNLRGAKKARLNLVRPKNGRPRSRPPSP
ncbi:hypothetical protein KL86DES1_10728 [uncultured Desulfovibrio sp.]|uniref:Uncharacterized protein n=1 Tax=uncultured Desulfovibrio sp. TaxID=167968 RepID=A0A212L066_9BACT|nr:hypothetical protein KL86DES1_10728 [uncultured Desulfovibrio sp.]VZH32601.1 conserved protein of unknown function [Desulfovibrio sp. 86]